MAEVKVQRDTKVTLCIDEQEAAQLMTILHLMPAWEEFPVAETLFEAMAAQELETCGSAIKYDKNQGLFVKVAK